MLTKAQRTFIERLRVGRLATADKNCAPHVVPVCFAYMEKCLYVGIDEKPKVGSPKALKRLQNIRENPQVAVVFDEYDEDWSRLGWVLFRGHAAILERGDEHAQAQNLLRNRYPQLREMTLEPLPVIAMRLIKVTSWGNLSP